MSLFLFPFAFFLIVRGQEPQPTFRAGTTLVEFTIVALDGKGNPITDLSKEEVRLTDGKQKRDVAFFRFDGEGGPMPGRAGNPVPTGFATNHPLALSAPSHQVVAIVLDFLNTAVPFQSAVRAKTLQYLRALPANSSIALFRFSDETPMTTLQPFTDRIDLVRSQIDALKTASRRELATPGHRGTPVVGGDCGPDSASVGPGAASGNIGTAEVKSAMASDESRALSVMNEQIRTVRLAKTLSSLDALGSYLSGIPGRKSLIWISGGMPILLSPVRDGQTLVIWEPEIRQAAQRLANQGIAVYPVDAKGGCRAFDKSTDQGAYGLNDAPERVFGTFDVVADVTGGRVAKYDNDPTLGLRLAAEDQRGIYTIGFYAPDESDDQWRSLKVELTRPAATVRHRQGYFAVRRAQPQSWSAKNWTAIAAQELDSTAIGLNGRTDVSGTDAIVTLQVSAADLYFHDKDGRTIADLEIGLVERKRGESTNVRARPMEITIEDPTRDHRSELIPLKTTWPLNPATTDVRAIVRDRLTGRYGTLSMPLTRGNQKP